MELKNVHKLGEEELEKVTGGISKRSKALATVITCLNVLSPMGINNNTIKAQEQQGFLKNNAGKIVIGTPIGIGSLVILYKAYNLWKNEKDGKKSAETKQNQKENRKPEVVFQEIEQPIIPKLQKKINYKDVEAKFKKEIEGILESDSKINSRRVELEKNYLNVQEYMQIYYEMREFSEHAPETKEGQMLYTNYYKYLIEMLLKSEHRTCTYCSSELCCKTNELKGAYDDEILEKVHYLLRVQQQSLDDSNYVFGTVKEFIEAAKNVLIDERCKEYKLPRRASFIAACEALYDIPSNEINSKSPDWSDLQKSEKLLTSSGCAEIIKEIRDYEKEVLELGMKKAPVADESTVQRINEDFNKFVDNLNAMSDDAIKKFMQGLHDVCFVIQQKHWQNIKNDNDLKNAIFSILWLYNNNKDEIFYGLCDGLNFMYISDNAEKIYSESDNILTHLCSEGEGMWQYTINRSNGKIPFDKNAQKIQYVFKVLRDVSQAICKQLEMPDANSEIEYASGLLDEVISEKNQVLKNIAIALKKPLNELKSRIPKTE